MLLQPKGLAQATPNFGNPSEHRPGKWCDRVRSNYKILHGDQTK